MKAKSRLCQIFHTNGFKLNTRYKGFWYECLVYYPPWGKIFPALATCNL